MVTDGFRDLVRRKGVPDRFWAQIQEGRRIGLEISELPQWALWHNCGQSLQLLSFCILQIRFNTDSIVTGQGIGGELGGPSQVHVAMFPVTYLSSIHPSIVYVY